MIRVLLVEDQEIVRHGLKTLLEIQSDLRVVAEADNGQQAIQQMQHLYKGDAEPDIILMDIRMPIMNGVAATKQLCQQFPNIKILILTTFDDTELVSEALHFGAKGYLLKDTPALELAAAIRSIYKGYTHFGPGILEKILTVTSTSHEKLSLELAKLTSREKEILQLIATGLSNREISQQIHLSEGTVRNHISNILSRLNLRNRTQAAIFANSSGQTYTEAEEKN